MRHPAQSCGAGVINLLACFVEFGGSSTWRLPVAWRLPVLIGRLACRHIGPQGAILV